MFEDMSDMHSATLRGFVRLSTEGIRYRAVAHRARRRCRVTTDMFRYMFRIVPMMHLCKIAIFDTGSHFRTLHLPRIGRWQRPESIEFSSLCLQIALAQ